MGSSLFFDDEKPQKKYIKTRFEKTLWTLKVIIHNRGKCNFVTEGWMIFWYKVSIIYKAIFLTNGVYRTASPSYTQDGPEIFSFFLFSS